MTNTCNMSDSQNGKRPLGPIIGQWYMYIEGQWFKSHSGYSLF